MQLESFDSVDSRAISESTGNRTGKNYDVPVGKTDSNNSNNNMRDYTSGQRKQSSMQQDTNVKRSGGEGEAEEEEDVVPQSVRVRLLKQCKSHHAAVSDIVLDTDLLLSRSVFDGVYFYHRNSGAGVRFMEHEGCNAWAIDLHNRRVVAGGPHGELFVFEYAAFAALVTREIYVI